MDQGSTMNTEAPPAAQVATIATPINLILFALFIVIVYMRLRPNQKAAVLPQPPPPTVFKVFTPPQLIPYSGTNNMPVYLAVRGKIFDVTSGRNFYGPGGPYQNFAGRDASRGLACGSFDPEMLTEDLNGPLDKLEDLGGEEMEALRGWEERFNEKYLVVGKLVPVGHEEAEPDEKTSNSQLPPICTRHAKATKRRRRRAKSGEQTDHRHRPPAVKEEAMVYYEPPKRTIRQRRPDEKADITDLPDELLLDIIDELDVPDALNLRRTCRALAPAAFSAIQRYFKTLYIHPSTSSLRAVPEICAHPISQNVEEVVLLGDVLNQEIGKERFKAQNHKNSVRVVEKKFSPWPPEVPKPKIPTTEESDRHTLHVLLESLQKLPKLQRLSFQRHVTNPLAFNQVSQDTIISFPNKFLKGQTADADARSTDVAMLMDLLTSTALRSKFTSLVVKTALPFAPGYIAHHLPNLTQIDLSLNLFSNEGYPDGDARWFATCAELLKKAENVESLKLTLVGTARLKKTTDNLSWALSKTKVTKRTWKHLRYLEIRQAADTWHKLPQRPSCQMFKKGVEKWTSFLERHAETLEKVKLSNVLFASDAGRSAIDTIKTITELLKENAVQSDYIINRFTHHQYCKKAEEADLSRCKCECGRYTPVEVDGGTTVRDFERLADELVIVPGARGPRAQEAWDFGLAVGDMVNEAYEAYA